MGMTSLRCGGASKQWTDDCGALSLPLSSPLSRSHDQIMALEEAITILAVLTPIAKAVPVLGAPVEGSLEALSQILEFAQVGYLLPDPHGRPKLTLNTGCSVEQGENEGACSSSRSLAEYRRPDAQGARVEGESRRAGGLATQYGGGSQVRRVPTSRIRDLTYAYRSCRALNAIVQFADHYGKQGKIARTIHKYKDEEELSRLHDGLEAAFKHFKV
jgi:hypothetical protein